jgi:flagellar protein FliS
MSLVNKSNSYTNSYKENEISTMSQGKLIVMLYDGAIKFLNIAIENMTPRKYEIVNRNILKTQDIISELMTSLNMDDGGKIANDLLSIYIYIKKRLIEANIEKNTKILREVIKLLVELKSAWEEIQKKESTLSTPAPKSSGISIQG